MNREFEEQFRKKFENFEGEVSPDLFDKIMDARKKSRKAAWFFQRRWWVAAAALLLIGSGAVMLWNAQNSGSEENNPVVQIDDQNQDQQLADDNSSNSDPIAQPDELATDLADEQNATTRNNTYVNPTPSEAVNNTPLVNTSDGDVGSSNDNEISGNSDLDQGTVVSDNGGNTDQDDVIGDEPSGDNSSDKGIATFDNPDEKAGNSNITDPEMDPNQVENEKTEKNARPKDPHKGRSVVSLNLYGGPGAAYRTLRSDNKDLVNKRNSTECFGLSYQFTAQVGYHFNRWSLWTGLNFSRNTHNFIHKENWETTDTSISSRQVVIVNPPPIGTVVRTVYDTSFMVNRHQTDYSTTNAINMVSLPIELERSFQIGNRMELMAKAGVSFNILTLRTGRMLSANGEIVNIASLPHTSVGFGNTSLALGAAYRLNNKTSLMFYPHFNYNLEPAFDKSLGFTQNDFSFYSHFGIRIDL